LQRIAAACAEDNIRVAFDCTDIGFKIIFYRPVNHINTDGNIGDSIGENETQKQIVILMKLNPKISAKAIATKIGIAPRNVEANIKTLKEAGVIKRIGSAKGGHWVVNEVHDND
jgi:ATP-dependent DNA helicase RecG